MMSQNEKKPKRKKMREGRSRILMSLPVAAVSREEEQKCWCWQRRPWQNVTFRNNRRKNTVARHLGV
jgi:hypothetical protein